MPPDRIYDRDRDRGDLWENLGVDGCVHEEAKAYVEALIDLLCQGKAGIRLQRELSERRPRAARSALDGIRNLLFGGLFQANLDREVEIGDWASRLFRRLKDDEPWYEIVAPLAAIVDRRLTYVWGLVVPAILTGRVDHAAVQAEMEAYCYRHRWSPPWDYTIEVRFDRGPDDTCLLPELPDGRLELPRLVCRRRRLKDDAQIVIRFRDDDLDEEID